MKKCIYISVVFCILSSNSISQTIKISGRVAPKFEDDFAYRCYIPAVRIFLLSKYTDDLYLEYYNVIDTLKPHLTVTDINGEFAFELSDSCKIDSLVFEHWAYKTKVIPISEFQKPYYGLVKLEPEKILLPMAIIRSKRKEKLPEHSLDSYTLFNDWESKTYSTLKPVFCGGQNFGGYIAKKIQDEKIKIRKPLVVEFTVDYKGAIMNVEVLSENREATNKEIKKIFEQTPKWSPGRARGSKMYYRFAVPVVFDF